MKKTFFNFSVILKRLLCDLAKSFYYLYAVTSRKSSSIIFERQRKIFLKLVSKYYSKFLIHFYKLSSQYSYLSRMFMKFFRKFRSILVKIIKFITYFTCESNNSVHPYIKSYINFSLFDENVGANFERTAFHF